MKPARILLLVVAIIAGGLAAFLATRGQGPAEVIETQVAQVVEEQKIQVLVAAATIGVGERLSEESVVWQDWPQSAIRPEYLTQETIPDGPSQMVGTIARFEIFAGEPIRAAKLVRSDQGYLSAVIQQGMRGVSVPVKAAAGAGGFIVPNDHVDVVKTIDQGNGPMSSTILANIKVLAIGPRLGQGGRTGGEEGSDDPSVEMFIDQSIATLEVDPFQAELLASALAEGELTLILRSIADFNEPMNQNQTGTNQSITLIRGGSTQSVQSNAVASLGAPVNDPTAAVNPADAILLDTLQPVFSQAGLSAPQTQSDQPPAPPTRR